MLYHTAYLSPWWGYPPRVLCCRSSGWCPHGGRSRSKTSHRPTASTGRRPPSGCYRALGSHDPLEEVDDRGDKSMGWRDEGAMKGGKKTFVGRKGHIVVPEWVEWGVWEMKVMLGCVFWCFCFLPVLFILHNQLSVWVPASLSQWGPTLSDVTSHFEHLCLGAGVLDKFGVHFNSEYFQILFLVVC